MSYFDTESATGGVPTKEFRIGIQFVLLDKKVMHFQGVVGLSKITVHVELQVLTNFISH